MEFKLNKIDTDIRKKMQEEIKDNRVHSGKSIDLKNEHNKFNYEKQNATKEAEKRYITIDGVMYHNKEIKVQAEKLEKINDENSKGRVLDTKK